MTEELQVGLTSTREMTVGPEHTAAAIGNDQVDVLSTPSILLLMELTCHFSLEPFWPAGGGSVGTNANFSHLAATPIGMKVRCTSEVIAIDRSRITFNVQVHDEVELIGEGTHERFIVKDMTRFLENAYAKRGSDASTPSSSGAR